MWPYDSQNQLNAQLASMLVPSFSDGQVDTIHSYSYGAGVMYGSYTRTV